MKGEWVAIDGSKFRAVSSAQAVREREAVKRYLDQLENADQQEEVTIDERAVAAALEKLKNDSEPEARFMRMANGHAPAYNVQTAVDAKHSIIVAQQVTTEANDQRSLLPMAEAAKQSLGDPETLNVVRRKDRHLPLSSRADTAPPTALAQRPVRHVCCRGTGVRRLRDEKPLHQHVAALDYAPSARGRTAADESAGNGTTDAPASLHGRETLRCVEARNLGKCSLPAARTRRGAGRDQLSDPRLQPENHDPRARRIQTAICSCQLNHRPFLP